MSNSGDPCGVGTVQYLDYGGDHESPCDKIAWNDTHTRVEHM